VTFSHEELRLATRNHGMPLEALRYPITPVGLHYLLVHYDVPVVDASTWRLEVVGERTRSLSLDDLRARPVEELVSTMECAGNGRALLEPRIVSQPWLLEAVGTARWRGTPLRPLLDEVGLGGAVEVLCTGIDRGVDGGEEQSYARSLPLDAVDEALLAYEMNGQPLPPQHGFPLRLVVPGWYGMTNVKWLARIDLLDAPHGGYQNAQAYRLRQTEDEDGEPVTRMLPRSLVVPPGIPEFATRDRRTRPGHHIVEGRAWSGHGRIARVEVSIDDGATWADARLDDEDLGPHAWRGWRFDWEATPGVHTLLSRAHDEAGNVQPEHGLWNLGGYANNAVQRVPVVVV
jgi:DMSO/TMAO reductase YedYZ molybdopterin-dependent catalytic subunit